MKKKIIIISLVAGFWVQLHAQTIRVGVFQGNGAAETCVWEAKAACEMDASLDVQIIQSKDIAAGVLSKLDVVVIPGGGGSREYLNLGGNNREALKQFTQQGGGLVGICAGAYLTSNTPSYSCLGMSGGTAIDIEHDNRGRGVAKMTLNEEGKRIFKEVADRDTLYLMYYEGPVIAPATTAKQTYISLGTMESDVHVEGNAPANMTNNRPFFYLTPYGKGKVFSSIGHPEATPGMQWMLAKMVHAVTPATKQTNARINVKFINPNLFGREILMTEARRKQENKIFKTLLYGNEQAKVEAIEWIGQVLSWDGKRWLQGLIFDESPAVRKQAAKTIAHCMYRYYLPDLKTAYTTEQQADVKEVLKQAIQTME